MYVPHSPVHSFVFGIVKFMVAVRLLEDISFDDVVISSLLE